MAFNPNELIIERVRAVEEYDTNTNEIIGRYTQIEEPKLSTSADGTDVNDAMGTPIATFYRNQQGTFSFTNSLFSLDLAASQAGVKKKVAGEDGVDNIVVPISETIEISGTKAVLQYEPVGTEGSEIKYVRLINDDNTFGEKYEVAPSDTTLKQGDKLFTVNKATKTLTFPTGTKGRVFVNYERVSTEAASVSKSTEDMPKTVKLLIHAIFCNPCDINTKYAGVVVCERAQIDPSSIDMNLTTDGKMGANYKLTKPYCNAESNLFDIIISK